MPYDHLQRYRLLLLLALFFAGMASYGWLKTSKRDDGVALGATDILLHTTLDDNVAITMPAIGAGGSSTLSAGDFAPGQAGNAANFAGGSKRVSFPVTSGATQNIELDHGEIEFWYRPAYAAVTDDDLHQLVVVGDLYNVPRLTFSEGDRLALSLVDSNWNSYIAQAAYHAPLWNAGEWVHLRAVWDTTAADPLQLYVNDVRVDEAQSSGGWNLGDEDAIGAIFVGVGNAAGDFSANGLIDELIMRAAPGTPASPTPTLTATATPTAASTTPTPTASPTNGAGTPTATPTQPMGGIRDPALVVTPAPLALPAFNTPFTDPVFGTTMRRITDVSATGFGTHIYSQLQAFSPDHTYILLIEYEQYLVRRRTDFALVNVELGNAPRWQPAFPHTLVHYDDNADTTLRVLYTDVEMGQTSSVFTFPAQYQRIRVNQSFDELAHDGRWMAGMAARSDGAAVLFALNLATMTLGAQMALPDLYAGPCQPDPTWGQVEPDWVGMSPLGNYLVVQWTRDGDARCSGLETFDPETGAFVGHVYDGHQHGDLGVDRDGSEFFMVWELAGPPPFTGNPALGLRRLPGPASGVQTPEFLTVVEWGQAGAHISCQGPAGVCLVTTGKAMNAAWQPLDEEIFLQYTDGSVLRLAHHRSSSCGYWVQPRASLARNGQYAIFASDWRYGSGGDSCGSSDLGQGEAYLLALGAGAPSITPTPTTMPTPAFIPTMPPTIQANYLPVVVKP